MWNVYLEYSGDDLALKASKSDKKHIGFYSVQISHLNAGVAFSVKIRESKQSNMLQVFLQRVNEIDDKTDKLTARNISLEHANNNFNVDFMASIDDNFKLPKLVIDILREFIPDFASIHSLVNYILRPKKSAAIQALKEYRQQVIPKIEAHVENTMRASVFDSARRSELALRDKYNFVAPMYEGDYIDEADSDYDPDNARDTTYDNPAFYSEEENQLISALLQKLEEIQQSFVASKHLQIVPFRNNIIVQLTRSAADMLHTSESQRALDVRTAIIALKPNGSHSHNGNMLKTKIMGYGMRNIVALCFKAITVAEPDDATKFMSGVTYNDALNALIHGIAEGARGGNRNHEVKDDLEADKPVCDQGKYNCLIEAFNGIFPNVNINYDITDLFVSELQNEIIQILINQPTVMSYATAELFLNLWHGKDTGGVIPVAYTAFAVEVEEEFDNMTERFITKFYEHAPDAQDHIRAELFEEIEKAKTSGLGFSYIEQISPKFEDLKNAWDEKYPSMTQALTIFTTATIMVPSHNPKRLRRI